jgi:uncharacterized protein
MRVAVSGASGLIGSALTADLRSDGTDVVRLVRADAAGADEIRWDPLAVSGGLDPALLQGVDAVIHLAGAPIAGGRWTQARKALLRASRIASTRNLVSAVTMADPKPGVLVCASAIGYYGDTGQRAADETAPKGSGFLADLVADWEAAALPAAAAGIRVVTLRSGIVLASDGGMLARLLPPFRLGLGARVGAGRQYLSWISRADEIRAIRFLLDRADASGPFNLTAPEPVTNAEFTRALARAVRRPARLALPAPLLRAGLGEVATELLASTRVVPARLTAAGFTFSHPDIISALSAVLAR